MHSLVEIPLDLQSRHKKSPEGRAWLDRLPGFIDEAMARWQLTLDLPAGAQAWNGYAGIVLPVRTAAGAAAALKIAFPFDEVLLEPVALKLWDGRGVVRVLEHDTPSCSMLLERLDAESSLLTVPLDEAIAEWGATMRRLSIAPGDSAEWRQIPHIAATAEQYSDDLPQRWEDLNRPFARWLLEAALEVCQTRGVVGRRSANDVLVHTDLHYLNILRKMDGSGYLAIDPQASIGEAEFAVAPCLWNRLRDLPDRGAEAGLRRRCAELSAAAGLEEGAAVEWAVLREVENALWYLENPGHDGDAQRSLWVASTMAGKTLPGLPTAHALKMLD